VQQDDREAELSDQHACAKRMAADVSAVGDPNTGLAVYNQANGG